MRRTCSGANQPEVALRLASSSTLPLFKGNSGGSHGAQTGDQKCRAKPLPDDLPVNLGGRFIDSVFEQHPRKLLVTDASANHLALYKFLCDMLPVFVRPRPWSIVAAQSAHRKFLPLVRLLVYFSRHSLTPVFGRIRPIAAQRHYTFSVGNLLRTRMLRNNTNTDASTQLPSYRGAQ